MKLRPGMFLVIGCLLFGCKKSSEPGVTVAPAITELRLGYFPNVTHAQAVLEVASGELQKSLGDVALKPTTFNAGPALIEALNAGEIDIGYVGPGPVLNANSVSQGRSVRVIAGAAANGVAIVAGKDSGIKTLADLRGKRIATPEVGNTQDTAARHYLQKVLGQSDDSNITPVPNANQEAMMARGQIDAAWVPEPWASRLIADTGATLIAEEKDLWPQKQFALTVVITTPKFLADHPDIVAKVLAVHQQWTMRLSTNPGAYTEQLNKALTDMTQKSLPNDVLAAALSRTEFLDDPLPDTFRTMAAWKFGTAPDLTGLFETGIMSRLEHPALATTEPATQP